MESKANVLPQEYFTKKVSLPIQQSLQMGVRYNLRYNQDILHAKAHPDLKYPQRETSNIPEKTIIKGFGLHIL